MFQVLAPGCAGQSSQTLRNVNEVLGRTRAQDSSFGETAASADARFPRKPGRCRGEVPSVGSNGPLSPKTGSAQFSVEHSLGSKNDFY